ncbi:MAG: HlyD family secretion protein [Parabacteroides sp.]
MKKNKNFTVILATALVLVGIILVVIVVGLTMPEHPDILQGQAETTDYRLSSKVPARIKELRVQEGDRVCRGDTLVILEAPDIEAKLAQAEAAMRAAEAQELKALNGTRQEQIQQAYEMWQQAKAALEVAEKTYRRVDRLFEQGVMAEQKRDEAKAQYEARVASEKAAQAAYDMALSGARQEDKAAAGAQVHRAKGAVSEVTSYIEETVLLATVDGEVTEIFPEVGELVGTGAPIMNVACTEDVWFTFNIREDLLPGLKVGTETEVWLPAYDRSIPVRITKMKDVGSFAVWKATKALDGFDLRTFEVEARPLQPLALEGVRSGMSAVMKR